MRRLRFFSALLLALLWVPATVHCGLGSAELIEMSDGCCGGDASQDDSLAVHDSCAAVERGDYQPESAHHHIAAPLWALLETLAIFSQPDSSDAAGLLTSRGDTGPPELGPSWHFQRRAALPARAPDSLS